MFNLIDQIVPPLGSAGLKIRKYVLRSCNTQIYRSVFEKQKVVRLGG